MVYKIDLESGVDMWYGKKQTDDQLAGDYEGLKDRFPPPEQGGLEGICNKLG